MNRNCWTIIICSYKYASDEVRKIHTHSNICKLGVVKICVMLNCELICDDISKPEPAAAVTISNFKIMLNRSIYYIFASFCV